MSSITRLRLFKDIGLVFSGNALNGLIGFLILISLTRWLNVSEYGVVSFFWTLIIAISAIYEFGVEKSFLILFGKERNQFEKKRLVFKYNNLRLRTIIVFILMYLFGESLGFFTKILTISERLLIILSSICYLVYFHSLALLQIEKNLKRYSTFLTFPSFFRLILILLCILFLTNLDGTNRILAIEASILFALLISAFLIQVNKKHQLRFPLSSDINFTSLKPLLFGSLIFGVLSVINKVGMRIDNIVIFFFLDKTGVGLFNAANNLALVFPMITTAILTVFFREFSFNTEKQQQHIAMIKKYQLRMVFPVIITAILLFYYSSSVIIFFLGSDYTATASIFQVLVIPYLGGILFTPLESYFFSYSQNFIFKVKLIQFSTGIIITALLILKFGIAGLGFSQLITRTFGWMVYTVKINKIKQEYVY